MWLRLGNIPLYLPDIFDAPATLPFSDEGPHTYLA
jgi:hypothetical protein